jgi:hypothetical protein
MAEQLGRLSIGLDDIPKFKGPILPQPNSSSTHAASSSDQCEARSSNLEWAGSITVTFEALKAALCALKESSAAFPAIHSASSGLLAVLDRLQVRNAVVETDALFLSPPMI